MYYPAIVEQENGTFGIWFPHFPGCVSAGDSLDEAMANAREALAFHVDGMIEDGEAIPAHDDAGMDVPVDAVRVLVPLVTVMGQSERVNLSVDKGKLKAIDAEAAQRGITRSAYMVEAALAHIR